MNTSSPLDNLLFLNLQLFVTKAAFSVVFTKILRKVFCQILIILLIQFAKVLTNY